MAASKWINHVKQWSKKNGMKYGDALGDSRCKAEYHGKSKTESKNTSSTKKRRGGKSQKNKNKYNKSQKNKK